MIRIAIVDRQAVARAGVKQLLLAEPDLLIAAEADTARAVVDLLRDRALDVLLLDTAPDLVASLDALYAIRQRRAALPVLVYSALSEQHHGATLLRHGATGFIGKDATAAELARAIRWVHQGHRVVPPLVADQMADAWTRRGQAAAHEQLSGREMQVFLGLAQGSTIGEISRRLCLSVKTVSTYRSRTIIKLQARTNSDLTYYALKSGLIE